VSYKRLRAIFRRARYEHDPIKFAASVRDRETACEKSERRREKEKRRRREAERRGRKEKRRRRKEKRRRREAERRLAEKCKMEKDMAAEFERGVAAGIARQVARGRSEADSTPRSA
jgi:hypothetical protein